MREENIAISLGRLMSMADEESLNNGRGPVEVSVVLERNVYDLIEKISRKLGMEPSSWISLILSSKVRGEVSETKDESL
jgi:hypothetical protein